MVEETGTELENGVKEEGEDRKRGIYRNRKNK
jgi:hypothetical protein